MRLIRAIIIALLVTFPVTIVGLMLWWIMGGSSDNQSFSVWFPCNIIPLAGFFIALYTAWKSGEEYTITENG